MMDGSENMPDTGCILEVELTNLAQDLGLKYQRKGGVKNASRTFDLSNWEGLSCHLLLLGKLQDKEVLEGKEFSCGHVKFKTKVLAGSWITGVWSSTIEKQPGL